jgi:hypothetical protein
VWLTFLPHIDAWWKLLVRGELVFGEQDEWALAEEDAEVVDAALAAFGLYLEDEAPKERKALPEFCVWPENALALILWLSLQTQWVYAADGQRVGLHYPSVWLVLEKHPKVREKEKA